MSGSSLESGTSPDCTILHNIAEFKFHGRNLVESHIGTATYEERRRPESITRSFSLPALQYFAAALGCCSARNHQPPRSPEGYATAMRWRGKGDKGRLCPWLPVYRFAVRKQPRHLSSYVAQGSISSNGVGHRCLDFDPGAPR